MKEMQQKNEEDDSSYTQIKAGTGRPPYTKGNAHKVLSIHNNPVETDYRNRLHPSREPQSSLNNTGSRTQALPDEMSGTPHYSIYQR